MTTVTLMLKLDKLFLKIMMTSKILQILIKEDLIISILIFKVLRRFQIMQLQMIMLEYQVTIMGMQVEEMTMVEVVIMIMVVEMTMVEEVMTMEEVMITEVVVEIMEVEEAMITEVVVEIIVVVEEEIMKVVNVLELLDSYI